MESNNLKCLEFDYDMVYVTQFYPGKLWVVWKEVATGKTVSTDWSIND